jgi:SAM-dependent methyltransferase
MNPTQYSINPVSILKSDDLSIPSFISGDNNVAWDTVASFGEEWSQFRTFQHDELEDIGQDYFHLLPANLTDGSKVALDVGCGSGRWTKVLAPKMKWVEAIDPSSAVFVAQKSCENLGNVRVSQASVDRLPFSPGTFDLVFSLGVLHHIPDTAAGIKKCVEMIRPGGWFLVYLYYNLDNRGTMYRAIFKVVNILRKCISVLPEAGKKLFCDLIAFSVYLPMATLSKIAERIAGDTVAERIPLNYYRKTRFQIMRNDARDRFGTPLERRFSRKEIELMLQESGLVDIRFSDRQPYWVALARKI